MGRLDPARSSMVMLPERARTIEARSRGRVRWPLTLALSLSLLVCGLFYVLPAVRLSAALASFDGALAATPGQQELSAALNALELTAITNPESPSLYRRLARGYLAVGRLDNARRAIEQAYRLAPSSLLVQQELALILDATGEQVVGAALREHLPTGDRLIAYAEAAMGSGQHDEALMWYRRAEAEGRVLTGAIAYVQFDRARQGGDAHAAATYLAEAVRRDVGWASAQQRADAWRFYGVWLVEQGRNAEAIEVLTRLISDSADELPPATLAEIYRFLGLAFWGDQQLAPALAELEHARALNPQSVWVQIHYGKVLYANNPSRIAEVREAFAAGLALGADAPSLYRNLIEFWRWQRQPAEAAHMCQSAAAQAVALQPDDLCP